MLVFSRARSITGEKIRNEELLIRAVSLDTFHELAIEFNVDMNSREIIMAKGSMNRSPFSFCQDVVRNLDHLQGIKIKQGVGKEVRNLLGGPQGCAQFVDLMLEAIKAVSQSEEAFVVDPDFDSVSYWHEKLKNTCYTHSFPLEQKRLRRTVSPTLNT